MSDQDHTCDVCHLPIDDDEWDDRHEPSDDSGETWHDACCPECAALEARWRKMAMVHQMRSDRNKVQS